MIRVSDYFNNVNILAYLDNWRKLLIKETIAKQWSKLINIIIVNY